MEIKRHRGGTAGTGNGNGCRVRKAVRTAAASVFLLVLAVLASLLSAPAASAAALSVRGEGYTAVLYDSANGLPTSDVNALVQSTEGFLWLGGYSGLIRYDGNEFYRYDSSTGISSVVSLFQDSRRRLWIGTNDSGIGVLENDQFRFYDREEGLRSSSIRALLEDRDGNILAATTMGMAYIDTENQLHVLDDPLINTEYVCELVMGPGGVIWGVTLSGAYFSIENLRLTGFYSGENLDYGVINTIYPDPAHPGFVWLGTQDAAVLYGEPARMGEALAVSVEPLHQVNCIRLIGGL
ncbi:MAG: histidine kinase, partial [Oscillibacter sp.]|nr:histidine kinase [Oscillibacter sp.]